MQDDYATLDKHPVALEIGASFARYSPQIRMDTSEWRRLIFSSKLVRGGSVLDVGCGPGVLGHLLLSDRPELEVVSVDVQRHSGWLVREGVEYADWNVLKATPDFLRPSSTVFCLQVLQTLSASVNPGVLRKLRALTQERLVISVPFAEREPLWWHDKLGGHRQRFTVEKLAEMFPSSVATILPRAGTDVAIIVEDKEKHYPHFRVVDRGRLITHLTKYEAS